MTRTLETAASVAGLAGLVGALLFYFGWARAASTFSYFGIELDVLDLSFRDYVLRSIGSAYWPAGVALVLALVALVVHRLIRTRQSAFPIAVALLACGAIAVALGAAAVARLLTFRTAWPVVPVLLLSGSIAATYGARLMKEPDPRVPQDAGERRRQNVVRAVVATLILLLCFWTVASYASYRGLQVAQDLEANIASRPAVMILSAKDLHITGSGTSRSETGDSSSRYRYCYTGLRLLIRSGGRYFLVPQGWRRGRDAVIVVPELDDVRFEFYTTPSVPKCES